MVTRVHLYVFFLGERVYLTVCKTFGNTETNPRTFPTPTINNNNNNKFAMNNSKAPSNIGEYFPCSYVTDKFRERNITFPTFPAVIMLAI